MYQHRAKSHSSTRQITRFMLDSATSWSRNLFIACRSFINCVIILPLRWCNTNSRARYLMARYLSSLFSFRYISLKMSTGSFPQLCVSLVRKSIAFLFTSLAGSDANRASVDISLHTGSWCSGFGSPVRAWSSAVSSAWYKAALSAALSVEGGTVLVPLRHVFCVSRCNALYFTSYSFSSFSVDSSCVCNRLLSFANLHSVCFMACTARSSLPNFCGGMMFSVFKNFATVVFTSKNCCRSRSEPTLFSAATSFCSISSSSRCCFPASKLWFSPAAARISFSLCSVLRAFEVNCLFKPAISFCTANSSCSARYCGRRSSCSRFWPGASKVGR
mmetsp:Transcript_16335/g.40317  ORF Transcript_16335/g.40317 Transcript_16335/m.40317 type:complete len:331 (-) Transcript_16335:959-1951(-)